MKKSVIGFNKVYKDYCDFSDTDESDDWESDPVIEEYKHHGRTYTRRKRRWVKKIPLNPSWETVASAGYTGGELRKAELPVKVALVVCLERPGSLRGGVQPQAGPWRGAAPETAAACYPLSHLPRKGRHHLGA